MFAGRLRMPLVVVVLAMGSASCRGCLETEVEYADEPSGSDASTATDGATSNTASQGSTSESSSSSGSGAGCPEDDDFEDGAISDCWQFLNEEDVAEGATGPTSDGYFRARPKVDTGWWDPASGADDTAWLMYQEVTGPFVASVDIATLAEEGFNQMAGLLVREPVGLDAVQSWVKIEMGRRGGFPDASPPDRNYGEIMATNTIELDAFTFYTGDEENPFFVNGAFAGRIGICRNEETVVFAQRPNGGHWVALVETTGGVDPFTPELPETVQVGLTVVAYESVHASIEARFDEFRITHVAASDMADCEAKLTEQSPP